MKSRGIVGRGPYPAGLGVVVEAVEHHRHLDVPHRQTAPSGDPTPGVLLRLAALHATPTRDSLPYKPMARAHCCCRHPRQGHLRERSMRSARPLAAHGRRKTVAPTGRKRQMRSTPERLCPPSPDCPFSGEPKNTGDTTWSTAAVGESRHRFEPELPEQTHRLPRWRAFHGPIRSASCATRGGPSATGRPNALSPGKPDRLRYRHRSSRDRRRLERSSTSLRRQPFH